MLALMTGRLYAIARNGGFKLNKKHWLNFLSLSLATERNPTLCFLRTIEKKGTENCIFLHLVLRVERKEEI